MYGVPGYSKKLKNGGPVSGPGTGTSDSIKAEVPEGSYILPTDTTAKLGFGMPGYKSNPKAASKEQPRLGWPGYRKRVPVNLSNGEHQLSPEQVHAVGVQALDQVKGATHAPVPEKQGPELFFANGGVVDDPEKKPWLGVPGNPERAARMQTQAQQPVTGLRGVVGQTDKQASFGTTSMPAAQPGLGWPGYNGRPKASPSPAPGLGMPGYKGPTATTAAGTAEDAASKPGLGWPGYKGGTAREPGVLDVPLGLGRAALGALRTPIAAGKDAVRNVAAYATGGDPSTLEGGSAKYRDEAVGEVTGGLAQVGGALERVRAAGREALGVQSLPQQPNTTPVAPGTPAAEGVPAAQGSTPTAPGLGWRKTGIGADRQGGEIATRTDANGVPEFTNEAATPGAVSGAAPGLGVGFARRNATGAAPAPGLGVGFARRGSASNVGNGVGTFSQGEPGDAQLALGRFERANQERAKMAEINRRDEGGGRLTVIEDSSRAPSVAEMLRSRMSARQAQTEAQLARTQQEGTLNAQRMNTEQLQQQRLQQELATGQYGLEDRQRLADLQAQIADSSLSPEARAAAQQAYNTLTATPTERAAVVRDAETRQQNQQKVMAGLFKTYSELRPTAADGQPIPFDQWAQPALQGAQPARQQGLPAGVDRSQALADARAAVASGVSRERVNQRLQEWGLEPI